MSAETNSEPQPPLAKPRSPWNRGKLIGQKPPLKLREVWSIRIRLQLKERLRDLAMFNMAIDSKLRGCDLVALRVDDVLLGGRVRPRAVVMQKKPGRPVQFEITEQTREDDPAMDQAEQSRTWSISVSEPDRKEQAAHDPALRPPYGPMDRLDRPGSSIIWDALPTPDEGWPDLSAHRKPSRCPALARAYQAGKHGPLSRDRSRRCSGNRVLRDNLDEKERQSG
jgi:hypothetical protein